MHDHPNVAVVGRFRMLSIAEMITRASPSMPSVLTPPDATGPDAPGLDTGVGVHVAAVQRAAPTTTAGRLGAHGPVFSRCSEGSGPLALKKRPTTGTSISPSARAMAMASLGRLSAASVTT